MTFTTNTSLIRNSSIIPGISDHDIIVTDSYIKPHLQYFRKRTVLLFNKANWDGLKKKCIEISNELGVKYRDNIDMHSMWTLFKTKLEKAISENIPSKTFVQRNSLPWMSQKLKKMIKKKARLHQQAKSSKDWTKYRHFQKECKKAFRVAETDYTNNVIQQGLEQNNPKPFWKLVKSKKQDNVGVSPLYDDGQLHNDSKSLAEILLRQFSSVFTPKIPGPMPEVKNHVAESLVHITIDIKGTENLLKKINPSKASGPDQIPNLVLKECAQELSPAVTYLFQTSLNTGTLPQDWTDANVAPVFKKGDRHQAENYRPVSLTSVLSKLLEHVVCQKMLLHFDKNKVLTHRNHGFRSGFSCETQLAITIDDLTRNFDNNIQTDLAILDFSKAFDTVPHDRLLHKLEAYGVRGHLIKWIETFLCSRKMRVMVNGEYSSEAEVLSGVPQGTVLGPILFLVMINDLPDCVKSIVRLFADDCVLYRCINNFEDCLILQNDLKCLEKWAEDWGMRFNAKKCYIMSIKKKISHFYQLNNTILQEVQTNPYLGLNISNDLKWSFHINSVCNKASCTLGFVRRNLYHCPKATRLTAYISLVRSVLDYGSIIWDPYQQGDIDKLERMQRQGARFVTNDYRSREKGCMTRMLEDLDLQPLQQRRKELRLTFLYKIAEGLIPAIPKDTYLKSQRKGRKIIERNLDDYVHSNAVSKYVTNNTRCFVIPQGSTEIYKQSFFVKTISDWNRLRDNVVMAGSVEQFKTQLKI